MILNNDLFTNKSTIVEYGNASGEDFQIETKYIISTSFNDYMNNAPFLDGLWGFVRLGFNKNVDLEKLQYFSLKDFCELSKEYNDNYASGVSFLDRRIFKEVDQLLIVQEKFVELMRVFLKIHI